MNITVNETYLEMFQNDYQSAEGYHRRAKKFSLSGFPANLVFHIATMALERYLVALCDLYGNAPENHNYACIMDAIESVVEFPAELNREIRSLDDVFGICSLEINPHGDPVSSDATKVIELCNEVQKLFATAERSVYLIKKPA